MRIKTQFAICLIVFTIILLTIAASVVITEQQVTYFNAQQKISSNLERGASNLSSIFGDYFLYQEDLQLSRWNSTLSSLSTDLANIKDTNAEQQMLKQTVVNDLRILDTQFSDLTTYLQSAPRNLSIRVDPAFQTRWSSMTVQSETLAFDASQLTQSISDQEHSANNTNILLILSLVCTFGALLATIYFIVFRRTLKSVTVLQEGIDTIGTGNLDYKINVEGQNEITQLSHAFNKMTTNLKNVTASKTDLENQIAERKRAEESLKQRTEELQRTQEKLEENAVLLEEYASQMEALAEQRANQLKDSERLAAIGATAGMVGHDIRNPLQAITSDLFLAKAELASTPESEEKKNALESLQEIENNIDYINKIVQDLQDYARPLNPKAEESDIELIVKRLIAKNGVPKNIKVSVKVADEVKKINADPYYINRIMYNLVTNSIQAMSSGGNLNIQAYKEVNDIVLTVKDTGVGIPKHIQDKMFTPMFTTKSKGQGFGLPVVKRMTESLGGTVTFESQEGKGTTFIVRLPYISKG
jgi:signal transduction histidine kinase